MYNQHNSKEECFIIIKRPCERRENSCNYPPELRFEDDNEKYYQNNWQGNQNYDFDDRFDKGHDRDNHCRCNCQHCQQKRQRKNCCFFNFFRCC